MSWADVCIPPLGTSHRETFETWFAKARAQIPHVPEEVAKELHKNWGESPYDFLPLDRMRFERATWPLERVLDIKFGSAWGKTDADVNRLDDPLCAGSWLGQQMLESKTWPSPPIVLDNPSGRKESGGQPMGRYHLVEGHLRLTYLRCLAHKNEALPAHEVWVARIEGVDVAQAAASPHGRRDAGYVAGKLHGAVQSLVASDHSLRERLRHALGDVMHLSVSDFPPSERPKWQAIQAAVRHVEDAKHGSTQASINAMDAPEMIALAENLLHLYDWARGAEPRRD